MELSEFTQEAEHLRHDLQRQACHYLADTDMAEDAVQETLVKLWEAKARIADASKMRNMASVVCRNVSLNMLRRAKRLSPLADAGRVEVGDTPQTRLELHDDAQWLRRCVQSLSDKQRLILRMRNVEKLSYAEIAKIMGTSESSVRGMVSKARQELLKRMKGDTL